ncbi:hypothetical protein JCM15519_14650 [Fundidesulfovibrio butyratiphilus]
MRPISDEDLLVLLAPHMDKARAFQAELSAEREKHFRLYRAEPYGNERPGWSQTVHPTIFSVVEWMKPGLIEVFTGDFFTLSPVVKDIGDMERREVRDRADRLKRYVRHKFFNQLEGERLIEDFVHDCLVSHYGVMKVTQRDDFDLKTAPLPDMTTAQLEAMAQTDPTLVDVRGGRRVRLVDPATGAPAAGLSGAKAVRKTPRYRGFCLEVVPARELYMLPGYADLTRNPFVAHVVKRDLDHIRRMEITGVYRKGSVDKVSARLDERGASGTEVAGEYASQFSVDGLSTPDALGTGESFGAGSDPRLGSGEVFVWECYVRLQDDTGLLVPSIVTLCEDVVLRGPVENPYGSPPFELGYIYKEPHKAIGRPIASVLDHRQRVLSNLLRNIQDQAAMSTYRGFFTTDARTKKALAEMGPGDVSLVSALNTVQEIVPTPADGFLLNAFQLTLQEVAKESGINENMQGLDLNALNKTAAGMQMRLTAGMQRQKLYARRLARTFKRILARILDIIRLYPPEDDRNILGADVALEPDDLAGEYTVLIDVGVGPQERQSSAHIMDELIQIMLKAGLQLGICEPKGLIKAIRAKYEYLDIDVSEYLLPEERFDKMAEQNKRIEELQGQVAGLTRAIAEHTGQLRGHGGKGPANAPGAGTPPAPGGPGHPGTSGPAATRSRAAGPDTQAPAPAAGPQPAGPPGAMAARGPR